MAVTQTGVVIIAEIPVVTAACFGALGFMIRRLFAKLDELEADMAATVVKQAGDSERITALEVMTTVHDRRLPTLAENLAVVAAFVDRHERWHERHDQSTHGSG